MIQLAYENEIRKSLGYPRVPETVDKFSACALGDMEGVRSFLKLLRFEPKLVFEKYGRETIGLFDDLRCHSQTGAAKDFFLYLDARPELVNSFFSLSEAIRERIPSVLDRIFLKLKAAQCDFDGGLYESARPCLHQAEHLASGLKEYVKERSEYTKCAELLRANLAILWARFHQLCERPCASRQAFLAAEGLFGEAQRELPKHFSLLRIRTDMQSDVTIDSAINELNAIRAPSEDELAKNPEIKLTKDFADSESVYGFYAAHYYYYLKGRVALKKEEYEKVLRAVDLSRRALREVLHAQNVNPIRSAFLDLMEGRAFTRIGNLGGTREHRETGIRLLLRVQSHFRAADFAPGEYLAARFHAEAKRMSTDKVQLDPLREMYELREICKNVRRVAERTKVTAFEIQGRIGFAEASQAVGRLDSVRRETHVALSLLHGGDENLKPLEMQASKLFNEAEFCELNSVYPCERWGASPYSKGEVDFVRKMKETSDIAVSVSGPQGSGRRRLAQRIHESRGRDRLSLSEIPCAGRSAEDIVDDIKNVKVDNTIVLCDFDLTQPRVQERVLTEVLSCELYPDRLVYVTLNLPLSQCEAEGQLGRGVFERFKAGNWEIIPLSERVEDTIPLARGFLIQNLIGRKLTNERDRCTVQKITFTGNAYRTLFQSFSKLPINDLYRAMETLAMQLNMETDVVELLAGFRAVTYETLVKYSIVPTVGGGLERGTGIPAAYDSSMPAGEYGRNILNVGPVVIQALAVRYKGSLSKLAKEAGVPKSTIREYWRARGMLDIWRTAGGRKRIPPDPAK